jgi:hypothetical protein
MKGKGKGQAPEDRAMFGRLKPGSGTPRGTRVPLSRAGEAASRALGDLDARREAEKETFVRRGARSGLERSRVLQLRAFGDHLAQLLPEYDEPEVPNPPDADGEERIQRQVRHLFFDALVNGESRTKPVGQAMLEYDVDDGGVLVDPSGEMAFYNPSAKREVSPEARKRFPHLFCTPVDEFGHFSQRYTGDLHAYLRGVDPEDRAPFVPIGDSLFDAGLLWDLGNIFRGLVELQTGQDRPLMIRQGDRCVVLANLPPDERRPALSANERFLNRMGNWPPLVAREASDDE